MEAWLQLQINAATGTHPYRLATEKVMTYVVATMAYFLMLMDNAKRCRVWTPLRQKHALKNTLWLSKINGYLSGWEMSRRPI